MKWLTLYQNKEIKLTILINPELQSGILRSDSSCPTGDVITESITGPTNQSVPVRRISFLLEACLRSV